MLSGPASTTLPNVDREWMNGRPHLAHLACLIFDRERAVKSRGRRNRHAPLASISFGQARQLWIDALVTSSGDRNRGRKAKGVARKKAEAPFFIAVVADFEAMIFSGLTFIVSLLTLSNKSLHTTVRQGRR